MKHNRSLKPEKRLSVLGIQSPSKPFTRPVVRPSTYAQWLSGTLQVTHWADVILFQKVKYTDLAINQ